MEVLGFALQLVLNISLTVWVVRADERRLEGERLARAWPPTSLWSAVVVFGPLCIPVHFIRTRRSLLGGLLGVAWMAAVLAVLGGLSALVEAAAGGSAAWAPGSP